MLLQERPALARRALACGLLDRLADAAPDEGGLPGRLVRLEDGARLPYQLGLLDALAALGAVELLEDDTAARVVSPLAGWALRLLSDLLDTGEPLVADWESPGLARQAGGQGPLRAVELLAALDRRRYALLRDALPVREVRAAVGVISRREPGGERSFLLAYDADAGAWQLPGGRRELGERLPRQTLLRELREELGLGLALSEPEDLSLRELPVVLVVDRDSPTYGLRTRARFCPFLVQLHRELPALPGRARWVTLAEIEGGRTDDGQPVAAEPLLQLLAHRGLALGALLAG